MAEEFELGRNVTNLAKARGKKVTAVISVRLDMTDVGRLEELAGDSGKTVSQVVRDAIAAYEGKGQPQLDNAAISRLEGIARFSGKTISQVIKEAIATHDVKRHEWKVGLWSGSEVVIGDFRTASNTARWEVEYSHPVRMATGTTVPIQAIA